MCGVLMAAGPNCNEKYRKGLILYRRAQQLPSRCYIQTKHLEAVGPSAVYVSAVTATYQNYGDPKRPILNKYTRYYEIDLKFKF